MPSSSDARPSRARSRRRAWPAGRRPDHHDDRHRRGGAVAGCPHRRAASGCAPTCAGCRSSGSAASRERPASRGCTTICGVRPTVSRCCCRWSCVHWSSARRAVDGHPRRQWPVRRRRRSGGRGRGAARRADRRRGPGRPRSRSHLYPDSLAHDGLGRRLDGISSWCSRRTCRTVIERYLSATTSRTFLAAHGLHIDDIGAWVSHPGGPEGHRVDHARPSACPTMRSS